MQPIVANPDDARLDVSQRSLLAAMCTDVAVIAEQEPPHITCRHRE